MPPLPLPTSLTFFLEIIVPGVLGGVLAYPLLPSWARVESGAAGLAGFVSLSLLAGIALQLLRIPLTEFAMGRFWIPAFRERAIRLLQQRADKLREEIKTASSGDDLPSPSVVQRVIWRQRLLDLLVTGPSGHRQVYCPTIIGNAYLSFTIDLFAHFEVEARLLGNPVAAWAAQSEALRVWYLLPKDLREELRESGAVGVSALRLSTLAGVLAIVYAVSSLLSADNALRDLALAVVSAAIARLAYVAGVSETHSFLASARALVLKVDRDSIQFLREALKIQAQQPPSGATTTGESAGAASSPPESPPEAPS